MANILTYINPYSNGQLISYSDGSQILTRDKIDYSPSATKDLTHSVVEHDSLWTISNKYYDDDKWWYVIFDANNLYNPFQLTPGDKLIIPDLDTVRASK